MDRLAENILYDAASAYPWSDLNETVFLERVLGELKALMGDAFREYTFFVLSSHDATVQPQSISDPSRRKVLVFISDESAAIPTALSPHYLAIFKAYLPREINGSNIFPFNLGYVRDVPTFPLKNTVDRRFNVFFSGSLSNHRLSLYRALHPAYRRLPPFALRTAFSQSSRRFGRMLMPNDVSESLPGSVLRFTAGFKRGLSPTEYGEMLADSRMVLCPRGSSSPETFRHIEAMRAGAVVVSEPLPQTRFYRDAPIVTVHDWETGVGRVKELLGDSESLTRIQSETLRWWHAVCSEPATAKFMYDTLREVSA